MLHKYEIEYTHRLSPPRSCRVAFRLLTPALMLAASVRPEGGTESLNSLCD